MYEILLVKVGNKKFTYRCLYIYLITLHYIKTNVRKSEGFSMRKNQERPKQKF